MCLKFVCVCFVLAIHFSQGVPQCPRTNKNPGRQCTKECTVATGCPGSKRKCLCDGDCGNSCVYPKKRCSRPRSRIRNGQIIFKSYRFNDTQRAVCKSGFKLTGSAVRTCRGIGFWDGKKARCRKPRKNCKDPGKRGLVLRYTAPSKSFKPGTKLHYYCPLRFTLKGSRVLVCNRDGKWSASVPQCIEPKCSEASLPAHAQVIRPKNWRNRKNYGVRLLLSCIPGYTSVQRATLTCDAPSWRLNPSSFRCQPKSCPDPGTPRNGRANGLFLFGKKVYFSCDQCYALTGPSYRECQADQTWTDSQPTCTPVTCSPLSDPSNGYITGNSQQCGATVQYNCNHGYRLNTSPRRRCQTVGTWSGNAPRCEKISASTPSPGISSVGTAYSQTVPSSPTTVTTATSTPAVTTTQFVTTIAVNSPCGYPVLTREAKIRSVRGNTIYLSCKSNYATINYGVMRCNQRQKWQSLRKLVCLARGCSDPGIPRNGYKHGLSYRINDKVNFSCGKCFRLVGHSQRTCLKNGSWSYSQPKCVLRRCPPPTNLPYASVFYTSDGCGEKALYTCTDPKLTMMGSGEKVCNERGIWTGDKPKCIDPNLNIALRKPATQSSYWPQHPGPALLAVDGHRRGGFTHTKFQHGAWWRVDLLKQENVSTVIVVTRFDCCVNRMSHFLVKVGDVAADIYGPSNAFCGGRGVVRHGGVIILHCPRTLRGRYVFVVLPPSIYTVLSLNEVEVYSKRLS